MRGRKDLSLIGSVTAENLRKPILTSLRVLDRITSTFGYLLVELSMKKKQNSKTSRPFAKAAAVFRKHGGVLRTMEAVRLGVHPRVLYAMRDAGILERLSRGLHRLSDLPPLGNPDLVAVGLRVPEGVLCLLSALAFHEMTTQVPHEVYVALKRGAEPPRLEHPPVRVFWLAGRAFTEGVETRKLDGVVVRMYGPAKTVADCFKYRNKLGLEVAVEALKLYLKKKRGLPDELLRYARVCRVEKVMRPYIEALL
jgi:predicted transcriptional regulator of viral defense system